ncbi:MAG: rubrerythrin-like domain-containing protein [Haloferacaceae archaeon]
MRPSYRGYEGKIYECSGCGARHESPETLRCEECGGTLINISKSRDL